MEQRFNRMAPRGNRSSESMIGGPTSNMASTAAPQTNSMRARTPRDPYLLSRRPGMEQPAPGNDARRRASQKDNRFGTEPVPIYRRAPVGGPSVVRGPAPQAPYVPTAPAPSYAAPIMPSMQSVGYGDLHRAPGQPDTTNPPRGTTPVRVPVQPSRMSALGPLTPSWWGR